MGEFGRVLQQNLLLLGFNDSHPDTIISASTFLQKQTDTNIADNLLHFLFSRLSPKEASRRFKGCWPVLARIGNKDFRLAAFKWAEELRSSGKIPHDIPVRRSFFEDGCGERFVEIITIVSALVMESATGCVGNVLAELIPAYTEETKGKIAKFYTDFVNMKSKIDAILTDESTSNLTSLLGDPTSLGTSIQERACNLIRKLEEDCAKLPADRRDDLRKRLGEVQREREKVEVEIEEIRRLIEIHAPANNNL